MIDSSGDNKKSNKSLSADSELQSAYEYLRNGDYKQCKRTIDKKLPKLKSDLDKVNFNIVKILLLNKSKKLKEAKKLVDSVKKEVIENPVLNTNSDLCAYFKNVLRELGEEQAANEIFKVSIKNYNLAKISKSEQNSVMKELTLNYDFQDLYAKINSFLKNENEPDLKFLTLMKYEIIYILAFKYSKLSKFVVNLTLKEMLTNYEKYSSEKGFIDILVKYLIALNDADNFLNLFENKKIDFTNAPMEDIFIDFYFKKNETTKLTDYLLNSIRNNIAQYNFNNYLRLINFTFHILEKNNLLGKINIKSIITNSSKIEDEVAFYNKLTLEKLNEDPNETISNLLIFFDILQNKIVDKKVEFNAYKSALLAKLTIYHNLVIITQNYEDLHEEILGQIERLLNECVTKQSILTELGKFFIYLNNEDRVRIMEGLKSHIDVSDFSKEEDKDRVIYYYKLEKMLNSKSYLTSSDVLSQKISTLVELYLKITSTFTGKLEKGERLTGDDIIILANEYLFEYLNQNSTRDQTFLNTLFFLHSINAYANERSPYNYDITLFYLKTAGVLNMPSKVLEILKFMNLKGPQFETVSYIALPFFINTFYKPGLIYLIESMEKWDTSNKKSIRKTFWKMFTGRNFWNTEELLGFLQENETSYYKTLLNYLDLLLSFNDNLTFSYEDEEIRKENFLDLLELLIANYQKFEKVERVTKNQDLLISIFKFKQVDFFNNNFETLRRNRNYDENSYKYKIDSLWKNSNVYELYPNFKNNYLIQDDTQVFGIFDQINLLNLRMLSQIVSSSIFHKNITTDEYNLLFAKYNEQILVNIKNNTSKEIVDNLLHFEEINTNLLKIYLSCSENQQNLLNEEEKTNIDTLYTDIKSLFLEKSLQNLKSYSFGNPFTQINFISNFQLFRNFYLTNFTFVTSKFVELVVGSDKKKFKDFAAFKMKFTNFYKSPMMNFLVDMANSCSDMMKSLNVNDSFDIFYGSISKLNEDVFKYVGKEFINGLAEKYVDEQKELFKNIMENSKIYKNFVKDNI